MSDPRPTERPPSFQLSSGLHLLPYGADELFVRAGSRAPFSKVLRDPLRRGILTDLVRRTAEPTSADDLALGTGASAEDVDSVLAVLLEHEVITELPAETDAPQRVLVVGDGQIAEELTRLLTAGGGRTITAADIDDVLDGAADTAIGQADILVLATDHLRPALNRSVNETCHELGTPFLLAYLDGPEVQVGPLVVPGESACYACFEVQDEAARHLKDEFLVYKDDLDRHPRDDDQVRTRDRSGETSGAPASRNPASRRAGGSRFAPALAAAWVGLALTRHSAPAPGFLAERVVRIDTSRLEISTHRVLQLPRCPTCSRHRAELRHAFL